MEERVEGLCARLEDRGLEGRVVAMPRPQTRVEFPWRDGCSREELPGRMVEKPERLDLPGGLPVPARNLGVLIR